MEYACEHCGQRMVPGGACDDAPIHLVDGFYARIPYGDPRETTLPIPEDAPMEMVRAIQEQNRAMRALDGLIEASETCHDCGVRRGAAHHLGCDVERCLRCRHQLIGCACQEEGALG